ncbi:MAG: matrixin family metalloprotease, partial [Thaumarchaeota archaeon]|nr:matrixin family metalloprotease [Nitrososphaerota archaeon]
FITIYDANKLTDNQLATIVRHEFGHALGLPHAIDPQDLMHATIQTDYPYISECDIDAVQSLYDNTTTGFCNTQ